jgi:hypothetical protein
MNTERKMPQTRLADMGRWQMLVARAASGHSLAFWLGCLLAALYFLPPGTLSNIGPAAIAIPTLLALTYVEQRQRLKPLAGMAMFFLVAGLWAVGITILNGGSGSDVERATGNFVTLALLTIFMGLFAKSRAIETMLWMTFAFAALSAAISLGLHFIEPHTRLFAIGRAVNPIPAAGGFAAGITAAFLIWRMTPPSAVARPLLLLGLAALITAMILTGSRGPIVGIIAALVLGAWLIHRPSIVFVLTAAISVFGGLVLLMAMEDWLRPFLCPLSERLCSPTFRPLIWGWTFNHIQTSPFLGTGPHHRFTTDALNNPHNGLFGLTMYYGIPFALIALTFFILALRRIIRDAAPLPKAWCIVSLIFTSAYIASDQSNIFAFFNTHYVFFWIPFLLAYASAVIPERSGEQTSASQDGAR